MSTEKRFAGMIAAAMLLAGTSLQAATFVYVSNADDGDIGDRRELIGPACAP